MVLVSDEVARLFRNFDYTVEVVLPDGFVNIVKEDNFEREEIKKIEEILKDYKLAEIFIRREGVNKVYIVTQFWKKQDLEAD